MCSNEKQQVKKPRRIQLVAPFAGKHSERILKRQQSLTGSHRDQEPSPTNVTHEKPAVAARARQKVTKRQSGSLTKVNAVEKPTCTHHPRTHGASFLRRWALLAPLASPRFGLLAASELHVAPGAGLAPDLAFLAFLQFLELDFVSDLIHWVAPRLGGNDHA